MFFQVCGHSSKVCRAIFNQSKRSIAFTAQKRAYFSRYMVVVNAQFFLLFANCTCTQLRIFHRLEIIYRKPVFLFQHSGAALLGSRMGLWV